MSVRSGPAMPAPAHLLWCVCLGLFACRPAAPEAGLPTYRPHAREMTITTVPLLVKEMTGVLGFLQPDFASGGILEGKEVYAFMPDHLTAGEGDTLRLTFYNPEDDVHSFVLDDFAVALAPQAVTHAVYVARRPGIFTFRCSVPTHLPMMQGQLVILPSRVMAAMDTAAGGSGITRNP